MLKPRTFYSLGQPAGTGNKDLDWRGAFAAGAFLAVAYFFVTAPETPEWAKRKPS